MADLGQIRIIRDPKRATNLHLANRVTLITPTKNLEITETTYYSTHLHSVPLSLLLDPIFRLPGIAGHTNTTLTDASASLLPDSLHVSVPNQAFHALGLQASGKHAPPHCIPPSRRNFVPVHLRLPLTPRSHARACWALSADRFPRFDITLSAAAQRIKAPPGVSATENVVRSQQRTARMRIPCLDNDEGIWEAVERVQSVGKGLEDGEHVHVAELQGLVNGQVVERVVGVAREEAKKTGWAAVMVRAPCAPLVWRNGISRGGFAQRFGGDAAEIFLCTRDKAVSVQLRAGLDVV